jgi:hypothetical protein
MSRRGDGRNLRKYANISSGCELIGGRAMERWLAVWWLAAVMAVLT